MKRIITFFLAVLTACALTLPAYAADGPEEIPAGGSALSQGSILIIAVIAAIAVVAVICLVRKSRKNKK